MSESNKRKTETVYHYTTKDGAKGIIQSGKIKASRDIRNDAVFGPGVYGTKVKPNQTSSKIAENNYDGAPRFYKQQVDDGKTDYAIKMKVPAGTFTKEDAGGRDVRVHKGDLDLSGIDYQVVQRRK